LIMRRNPSSNARVMKKTWKLLKVVSGELLKFKIIKMTAFMNLKVFNENIIIYPPKLLKFVTWSLHLLTLLIVQEYIAFSVIYCIDYQ
jgi:hypothetical protein